MKLRRLLAALLVFVLVLTSSPVVYATSTEAEIGQTDPTESLETVSVEIQESIPTETENTMESGTNPAVSATDTSKVLRSSAVKYVNGNNFVERGDTTGIYGDDPRIDTLLTAAVGEFNKSGEEWPWIAYKVSVPAEGAYTLGVTTNSCKWANFKLPMVVNGNVYTLAYTAKAQTQTADVTLPAGEHVVVVFWPMPANESEVYPDADWNSYLWCNIASVVVDSALTVSAAPAAAEAETAFKQKVVPVDQTIAANDESYMLWSNAVANTNGRLEFTQRDAVKADLPYADSLYEDAIGQFNKSGEEWGWFAYKVTAFAAGTYTLSVSTQDCRNAPYIIPLCVNGEVYKLAFAATKAQTATAEVALPAGTHIVTMFMPMPANAAGETGQNWVDYPWCNVQSVTVDHELTVSKPAVAEVEACFTPPADTVIAANNANYVLPSAAVADNGKGYLEFNGRDAVKADKPYIESLYENAIGQFNKSGEEWGWFAYKVTAPAAGTYTLGVETNNCRNAPYYIPLYVNGSTYTLAYSATGKQTETAEVTLPAGTHTVVVFMPMPVNAAGETGQNWVDYPWCNVQSVIVDYKLTPSKATVAEVEACFPAPDYVTVPAVDSRILLSSNMKSDGSKLGCINQGHVRTDAPLIETLYADAFNQFNKAGAEWNWFAYKITAPTDGIYTLGVETAGCKNTSYTIPMCVNGQVYTLNYTAAAQKATKEVTLAAGEYVVVVFSPMPANQEAVTGTANVDYPWCDFSNIIVDYDLTVSNTAVSEVEACFPKVDTVLGASDARLLLSETVAVKVDGGVNVIYCAKQDYVRADAPHIDSLVSDAWGEFNKSGEEWNWFAYKVNAPMDGEFAMSVKVQNCKFASYKIPMVVDGEVHTLNFSAKNQTVTENVKLTAGEHIVLIFMPMPQNAAEATMGVWNDHPWCNVESVTVDGYLEVRKPTEAELDALFPYTEIAPGNKNLVLTNKFEVNGDTLSDADLVDMRADLPSIESLTSSGSLVGNWPFVSMKVNAPADGNYTFKLKVDVKPATASKQMGVLLDGKAYSAPVKFYSELAEKNAEFASFTAYLTAGDHEITFFPPMPKSLASNSKNVWDDYVWINVTSIRMTPGLTVSEKITLEEITDDLDNRIEAENAEYVVYNLTNSKGTPQANGRASGGYLIGDTWNSNINQTFDQVATWINSNKQAYIEYAVIAPASGEYDIAVGFQAGASDKSVAKPYIAVLVNNDAYKAQFTKDWDQVDTVKLTVKLQQGMNIIRCTGVTVDQPIYKKGWINFDFLDLDNRLTPVKHSSTFMEAENAKYFNKFKVQAGSKEEGATGKGTTGRVLGSSDRKYIHGQSMTLENFEFGQLKQIPYFSVTVNAPMDGYYPISLKVSIDGRQKNNTIGMIVDDIVHTVKYEKLGKQAKDGEVDTLVYLKAGEHVLTFTAPMPATADMDVNYSYYWCNYDSITLYNGLTFAKKQKEPIMDPDYTRIEVEDYAMFNLCGDNGTAAGNGYYKVSQSWTEIKKDGIDGSRTPYVELKVNAKKAGPYAIFVGITYGMTEGSLWNVVDGKFVVDVNGKLETKPVRITKTAASTVSLVWIILEEGENTIRLTHLTSDAQHGGTTWIDFDYIEMPYWVTKGIEFVKPSNKLEAENANFDAFAQMTSKKYSGGAYLGRVNYDTVDEVDITHETLDPKNLGGLPHVTYRVFAEKAGTYQITVGFAAGLTNYPAAEMAAGVNASYTVIVNSETKQRVEFNLKSASVNMARIIEVELQEGENEITVTGTTSEYVIDRKPRNDETYRLVWIDQDYLQLPTGLTGTSNTEENLNINDSDFDYGQLDVEEKPEQEVPTVPTAPAVPAEAAQKTGVPSAIWIVGGVGAAAAAAYVLLIGKKRR